MSSRAVGGASSSGRIGSLFSFILSIVLLFGASGAWAAEARSITGVERSVSSSGEMSLNVTFEAGEAGDKHALYIAYDTEDKGNDIANWATLQRGCNVTAEATSATIPVSPLLLDKGYVVCRVFLTTSAAPYDTLIESLRQTGSQYIDTGIYPDYTTVAVMDVEMLDTTTAQQRFFGVSDVNAVFAFDVYINKNKKIASACADGGGDFKASGMASTTARLLVSLSAAEKRLDIKNLVSGATAEIKHQNACSKTSAATLPIFVQHMVNNDGSTKIATDKIANGARLYSFTMTKNSEFVCDYKPCKLGDSVGVYDSVTDTIIYSASGTDFDAANSGSPVACSLLVGETQHSAAPSATGLFFDYTWRGTAANWGDTDAWEKDGANATWSDGNNAIFATANATATLADDVSANSIAFSADATVAGTDTSDLSVKSVSVDSGVFATISAPISSAFEKTGAGALTLTQNRTFETTVTEGTLKMDGATVSDLTLGTDGGAPVALDYGGQELLRNPQDFLVTGSTVTLTNGIFTAISGSDLNFRDDLSETVFSSVLTIAKDATVRENGSKKVYICKGDNGTSTINVAGGTLGKFSGTQDCYIQHKSVSGRVNINVTNGGLLSFPGVVYALCRGDIDITSPSLYMTLFSSTFNTGSTFNFGSSYSNDNYVPTNPTGVFAATNSVVSVGGDGFIVGRNKQDAKADGSLTVDFENCVVTAKTFAVYYDRQLNNARFNGTRFVCGAAGGSIVASDGEANWFTVGNGGLTIDTQTYSAALNANLGGSGTVTKVGAGTLTVSRDQATAGGISIEEGTLAINGSVTFAGPVTFAADTALDILSYNGTTPVSADALRLPDQGKVALTLNGGAFAKGVYAICSAPGVTAEDGGKFEFSTADDLRGTWSVPEDENTLFLTVGEVSGDYWTGRGGDGRMSTAANWLNGVPESGMDIDLSFLSSDTTIIADTGRTFGTVTMGSGVITFTNDLKAAAFSDLVKVVVAADSTVTIDGNVTLNKDGQRLCNKIAEGGTLRITGNVEISHPSGEVKAANTSSSGAVVVDGGIKVNAAAGSNITWNMKTLALGSGGISFTENTVFRFWQASTPPEVYPLDETMILGTDGKGRFRSSKDIFLVATRYGSDQPAVITFNGNFNGATSYWGHWQASGSGRVVCTSAVKSDRGMNVYDGATLALNPNTATLGQNDQTFYVYNKNSETAGGTLEVASSGIVTLTGDLKLEDGAMLGFNFTRWNTPPQLALSSGKKMTASGAVTVNVYATGVERPKGGEYVLTTCGGFSAEGVSVSLAEGAPRWAKRVYVNTDGNIVLEVKPKGTKIIVR